LTDFAEVRLAILTRHSPPRRTTPVHPCGKPQGILAKANKGVLVDIPEQGDRIKKDETTTIKRSKAE